MEETVILVDHNDREVGGAEKLQAHREGSLHRAFSVFVFNSRGELLLQQRARAKYHSGGLWTNTCCSHPRLGEGTEEAAHRRLVEEMGFDCELEEAFHFTYRVEFGDGLVEHEFDHVFLGRFDGAPTPDPQEVGDWKWADTEALEKDLGENPGRYAHWFKLALPQVLSRVRASKNA
jgi:isopentenyl-diphosphate delta-isomerase